MSDTPDIGREDANLRSKSAAMNASKVRAWFVREVLPLEAALMQFLRRSLSNKSDVDDVRQDVYVRVFEAARREIPVPARPFVFTVARNLVIDRMRKENVIPIEVVADLDTMGIAGDEPSPDRNVIAREDLARLQRGLDLLSPRIQEAVVLRKIEGLSRQEIAVRMGISEHTVDRHLTDGMCALADLMFSDPAELRSKG
jgi:RNA polymerase sigma factor (sigma-70 family)